MIVYQNLKSYKDTSIEFLGIKSEGFNRRSIVEVNGERKTEPPNSDHGSGSWRPRPFGDEPNIFRELQWGLGLSMGLNHQDIYQNITIGPRPLWASTIIWVGRLIFTVKSLKAGDVDGWSSVFQEIFSGWWVEKHFLLKRRSLGELVYLLFNSSIFSALIDRHCLENSRVQYWVNKWAIAFEERGREFELFNPLHNQNYHKSSSVPFILLSLRLIKTLNLGSLLSSNIYPESHYSTKQYTIGSTQSVFFHELANQM